MKMLLAALISVLVSLPAPAATINVMAPLVVGDPAALDAPASAAAWKAFDAQLAALAATGIDGVSTDVWWGIVEPEDDAFQWAYYDRLAAHVLAAGLKWVPILSFHQCGGNVGDDCNVPLPSWVFAKVAARAGQKDERAVQYVSEQGNASREYVSVWATQWVLDDYAALMSAFQSHFAALAPRILEINVSLGPSGELRYPSYNAHDQGSGYPTRGALQAYSTLARQDLKRRKKIAPPADPEAFFARREHLTTQSGRDFISWYHSSLLRHGELVMSKALAVFATPGAAFSGIDLGAKIPGIHWRVGHRDAQGSLVYADRLAEIAAGLIRTLPNDWTAAQGHGYAHIVSLFARLNRGKALSRVVLHFTCLEMPDGQDLPEVASLAASLVGWVGTAARRQGVPLKGENALGWNLPYAASWELMRSALSIAPTRRGDYEGLTLLRSTDIVGNETAMIELAKTVAEAHGQR